LGLWPRFDVRLLAFLGSDCEGPGTPHPLLVEESAFNTVTPLTKLGS
jgi:hypothetical protein